MSQQTLAAWHRFTITLTALAVVGIGLTKLAPAQQQRPQPSGSLALGQTPTAPSEIGRYALFVTSPALTQERSQGPITCVVDTKTGQVWQKGSFGSGNWVSLGSPVK